MFCSSLDKLKRNLANEKFNLSNLFINFINRNSIDKEEIKSSFKRIKQINNLIERLK